MLKFAKSSMQYFYSMLLLKILRKRSWEGACENIKKKTEKYEIDNVP